MTALCVRVAGGLIAAGLLWLPGAALAFCGLYVAQADTDLFNRASRVVLARDGNHTVLTMMNDYTGEPADFALVVPVPEVLARSQIRIADAAVIDHLDRYTAPRLVAYHDNNPCMVGTARSLMQAAPVLDSPPPGAVTVTVEASFTVGEYDIQILSATESDGLVAWLQDHDYRVPAAARPVLADYIADGMKFFVARVNLEQVNLAAREAHRPRMLRPLQMSFRSPRLVLPIRLGMVNAAGQQDLFVFALSRKGRVDLANYPVYRIPTDAPLPLFVAESFGDFYSDMFATSVQRAGGSGAFLEYAWDMAWCDPCAADPLDVAGLRELGAGWVTGDPVRGDPVRGDPVRGDPARGGVDVFVTRLHLRYDAAGFPEDLLFRETGDRENFQGRYILTHPWQGDRRSCPAAADYIAARKSREAQEAFSLGSLTGWPMADIQAKIRASRR